MAKLIGREVMAACGMPDMITDDDVRKTCSKGYKPITVDESFDWRKVRKNMRENMLTAKEETRLMTEGEDHA